MAGYKTIDHSEKTPYLVKDNGGTFYVTCFVRFFTENDKIAKPEYYEVIIPKNLDGEFDSVYLDAVLQSVADNKEKAGL